MSNSTHHLSSVYHGEASPTSQSYFTRQLTAQPRLPRRMTVPVAPAAVLEVLILIASCLLLIYVVSQVLKYGAGHDYQMGLEGLFNLDLENNIPSWFASSMLLLCSGLLAIIGAAKRRIGDRYSRHWSALALMFLLLSIDEAASIHEMVSTILKDAWHTTGYLAYAWVIPAALVVVCIGLSYLWFIMDLPSVARRHFLVGGALYVGGALGIETLAAKHASLYGDMNWTYANLVAVEEGLEMYGVVVFLYGLSLYMASHLRGLSITCGVERNDEPFHTLLSPAAPTRGPIVFDHHCATLITTGSTPPVSPNMR